MTVRTLAEQIRDERLALIALLEDLDDAGWATPSLCAGWTVQDVAAHLAWAQVFAPVDLSVGFLRAGLGVNRFIAQSACRWSRRGREAILAQLRVNAETGAKPIAVPDVGPLSDAIVRGYDIRRPLGLSRLVPADAYATAADWHAGLRFPLTLVLGGGTVARRVEGLRLVADDVGGCAVPGRRSAGPARCCSWCCADGRSDPTKLGGPGATEL